MTHTVGVVVGVAYMLMWSNHRSVGVVTWLLSTNEGRMTLNYPNPSTDRESSSVKDRRSITEKKIISCARDSILLPRDAISFPRDATSCMSLRGLRILPQYHCATEYCYKLELKVLQYQNQYWYAKVLQYDYQYWKSIAITIAIVPAILEY